MIVMSINRVAIREMDQGIEAFLCKGHREGDQDGVIISTTTTIIMSVY